MRPFLKLKAVNKPGHMLYVASNALANKALIRRCQNQCSILHAASYFIAPFVTTSHLLLVHDDRKLPTFLPAISIANSQVTLNIATPEIPNVH